MAEVYIFFAEGFEEVEGLTVVDILRRAGINIHTVSITKSKMVTSSHRVTLKADMTFDQVPFEEADMLILPGGMPGTKNLLAHKELCNQLKEFYRQGKMLGAICAAPMVLGENGILEGKKAVCYPGFEEHLKGADIEVLEAVQDGNVITSRGLGTAIEFGLTIVSHFMGKEKADEIKNAIIYKAV